jgi:hypothetical protein
MASFLSPLIGLISSLPTLPMSSNDARSMMIFLLIPRDQPRRGRVCDAPQERPESKRSGDRARGWCGLQREARSLGPLSGHAPDA